MTDNLLITTPLEQTWKTDVPFTLLGRWCLSNLVDCKYSESDFDIEPYHWDNRKKASNDYIYLSSVYETILTELTVAMNSIHNVKHDIRYWRIVLGPWLGYVIQILFDRWCSIEDAAKSKKKYETEIVEFDDDEFIPNDFNNFSQMFVGDKWNHFIYGSIIKKFPSIKTLNVAPVRKEKQQIHFVLKKSLRRHLGTTLRKIGNLFIRNTDNFFISAYLPISDQVKLQMSLGQFPMIYRVDMTNVNYVPDAEMRHWELKPIKLSESRFENWLREFIPQNIPTIYLEGYRRQLRAVEVVDWPKEPKTIWTSTLFSAHELFKLWTAEKVSRGSKLIIGQHGGNFGMAEWNFSEDHQIKISDKYFSWGWRDSKMPKVTSVGQLKNTPKIENIISDNTRAILVTMEMPKYSYFMFSAPIAGQWLDYMDDQYSFIGSLPHEIRDEFKIRLKVGKDGWHAEQRWHSKFPEIGIDRGDNNFFKEIAKYKLVVSTYNAATYLESLAMNIPTVIFWKKEHWELRKDAVEYLDELEKVGIFHSTPESAARHIANIWDDIYGWWNSSQVQAAVKRFCSQYSSTEGNLLGKIKVEIQEM